MAAADPIQLAKGVAAERRLARARLVETTNDENWPPADPRPPVSSFEEFGDMPEDSESELDQASAPFPGIPGKARFVPVAIDDVAISPDPIWLIDGLLPARGLAFIVGPPKSGKSFLTSDMLCSVARGALYAGRQTLQGPVVYLTGEGVSLPA